MAIKRRILAMTEHEEAVLEAVLTYKKDTLHNFVCMAAKAVYLEVKEEGIDLLPVQMPSEKGPDLEEGEASNE